MSSIVVSGDTSGAVTLSAPAVAGTVTVTLPAASGTMASLASVTANGVAYVNSSSQPTSGSALVFDGTNFSTTGSATVKNLLLTAGTLPGAGNPSIALRSSDNIIYHQSGSANSITFLDSAQNAMYVATATQHTWNISNAEKMRIDSSGNLLVGKTSSSPTVGDGFGFGPDGQGHAASAYTTNAATVWSVYSTGAAAYRFYVGYGGTIFATSITITAISDERLKENVRDIDTGLDSIMALKPRRFDWKEGKGQDKKNVAGFIAQEFEDVFPECVSTSMAGADGIEYKNINHETLIPTLVKAIQEQQSLITTLTARITALESV